MRFPWSPQRAAKRVCFSDRAHAAIVAETAAQHPNETGGILLGHSCSGVWHVIEAIDPGPAARFSRVTFEYDTAYVNHLARKVAGHYQRPLRLIGLWHRHPGSFDQFSLDDDITNHRYACQSPEGAISCLVNLDPHFRITAYHVPQDLHYRRLPHQIGDGGIPAELMELRHASCLDPGQLEDRRQRQALERLLPSGPQPPQAGPLAPALAALVAPLLEVLDGQRRFAYGLQVCGPTLVLALVERGGAGLHRLTLLQEPHGEVRLRRHGGDHSWPWDVARFRRWLRGGCHG
ncbi:Mov34/MPN/PAD-1 family protein [Vulcanococcus limneticus]|uniref:Mov34/MPN/PAD-1 family protein n=1 Tax=Vulcanococcus limneticus TaxID=2170428 RepID=UPI00398C01C7